MHLRHHLAGNVVHLVGINAGDGVGELPLRVRGRARADLEHRIRLQEGHGAGNRAHDLTHELPGHLAIGGRCDGIFQEREQHDLIRPRKWHSRSW